MLQPRSVIEDLDLQEASLLQCTRTPSQINEPYITLLARVRGVHKLRGGLATLGSQRHSAVACDCLRLLVATLSPPACGWCVDAKSAMDVVGGVIVAAGEHSKEDREACHGLVKRGRDYGDAEGGTVAEEPWNLHHPTRRVMENPGSASGGAANDVVDLHEDYELQSVLSLHRPANPTVLAQPPHLLSRSWVDPLRFLLKKELTVTDVGDLGRIILPKRDAECQLPHLDSKEGRLLSVKDYNSIKNWTLRYKWWPNNKSRMYVLESTGEFVKYYDLKEKDELILYQDGVGNLVIRGQKWSSPPLEADSLLGSPALKGPTPTGKRPPKGANRRSHPSRAGSRSSSRKSSATATLLTTSVTSVFSSSSSSYGVNVDSANTYNDGVGNLAPSVGGPYGAVAVQSDHGACTDWEKLPDPPAIEYSDPPAIEFPGEFE